MKLFTVHMIYSFTTIIKHVTDNHSSSYFLENKSIAWAAAISCLTSSTLFCSSSRMYSSWMFSQTDAANLTLNCGSKVIGHPKQPKVLRSLSVFKTKTSFESTNYKQFSTPSTLSSASWDNWCIDEIFVELRSSHSILVNK